MKPQVSKVALLAVCLAVGGLAGCAATQPVGYARLNNVDAATGNLIAFWLRYPDRPEYPQREKPVVITEPWAVFMVWMEDEKRFFLYDNGAKRTFSTSDFNSFLAALDRLPRDIPVLRIDSCCVSRAYDMPAAQRQRLMQVMQSGKRRWAISTTNGLRCRIVCICGSAIVYPH